jgi:hypothetical protein
MDTTKLRRAAQMMEPNNPDVAQELNQTANDFDQRKEDRVKLDPNDLNPRVKNYGSAPGSDEKPIIHEITFSFEVGPEVGETDLLNHAWRALKELESTLPIKVKSFSFDKK